jgi:penicillin-binding protein
MDILNLTPDENGLINPGNNVATGTPAPSNTGNSGNTNGVAAKPGTGSPTPPVKEPPQVPAGLAIKTSGAGILLNWNANADKESVKQYVVYFSNKENGTFTKLGTANNGTEFRYYAASYDGYYKITAVNDAGESKASPAQYFKK